VEREREEGEGGEAVAGKKEKGPSLEVSCFHTRMGKRGGRGGQCQKDWGPIVKGFDFPWFATRGQKYIPVEIGVYLEVVVRTVR
jgi:hypothetical protein